MFWTEIGRGLLLFFFVGAWASTCGQLAVAILRFFLASTRANTRARFAAPWSYWAKQRVALKGLGAFLPLDSARGYFDC